MSWGTLTARPSAPGATARPTTVVPPSRSWARRRSASGSVRPDGCSRPVGCPPIRAVPPSWGVGGVCEPAFVRQQVLVHGIGVARRKLAAAEPLGVLSAAVPGPAGHARG